MKKSTFFLSAAITTFILVVLASVIFKVRSSAEATAVPTPGSSGESVVMGTPAEEASVSSSEAADSPSQSVEARHTSEAGIGHSSNESHEERSSSENSHADSGSGSEH